MRTEHLTPDELEALARDEDTGSDVSPHLAACAPCREAAREARFATRYVRPLAGDHPDEHVLTALWSNALSPSRKAEVKRHVTECSRCRAILERLVRVTPVEAMPGTVGDRSSFRRVRISSLAPSCEVSATPASGVRHEMESEMEIVRKTLKEARLGAPKSHANLAAFPLWTTGAASRPYMTLDEALSSGKVRVTEVSQAGSVPELCLVNDADRPVLMLDGEELLGAKQNRVLNLTILAPAGKTIVVPVSCVESGRWALRSAAFASSDHILYSKSRAANAAVITGSLGSIGKARSNQGAVWASIEEKMARLGTSSRTSAMEDIYDARRAGLDAFVAALRPEPDQTGAVFALNGRVAGLELFDHPDALAGMFEKLVRSWALDAIEDSPGAVSAPPTQAAHDFLELVGEAEMKSFAAVGQGTNVRLSGAQVSGGAVVDGGRVVHLNAFRRANEHEDRIDPVVRETSAPRAPRESWIVRASRRLRRRD